MKEKDCHWHTFMRLYPATTKTLHDAAVGFCNLPMPPPERSITSLHPPKAIWMLSSQVSEKLGTSWRIFFPSTHTVPFYQSCQAETFPSLPNCSLINVLPANCMIVIALCIFHLKCMCTSYSSSNNQFKTIPRILVIPFHRKSYQRYKINSITIL